MTRKIQAFLLVIILILSLPSCAAASSGSSGSSVGASAGTTAGTSSGAAGVAAGAAEETTGAAAEASSEQEPVDTWCYDCLSGQEQIAYEAMLDCLTHLNSSWNCGSIPQETIQKAYDCLLMDHPEIFWSDGYTYVTSYVNNVISGHRVEFKYSMDRAQIAAANDAIYRSLVDVVRAIGRTDASYETVRAVYEYLIENCTYDELNLDQTMYSVMVNHSGVCASFAKSFEFIMQCFGIPCTVVHGRLTHSTGMLGTTLGHAWNVVKINGRWYHVDVTSGLSVSSVEGTPDYRFLCITTDELVRTHVIENAVSIPECSSDDLEFFRRYGMSVDSYSRKNVAKAFLRAEDLGMKPTVRFTSYRAFTEAIDDLFTQSGVFDMIDDYMGRHISSLEYSIDEQMLTIMLDI